MRERQINTIEVLTVMLMVCPLRVRPTVAVSRSRHGRREFRAIRGWRCTLFAALVLIHFITCKIRIASPLEVGI